MKTNFHKKSFAFRRALKRWQTRTRKWPIDFLVDEKLFDSCKYIHLKKAAPIRSSRLRANAFFEMLGFAGKRFFPSSPPPPSLHLCSRPIFARSKHRNSPLLNISLLCSAEKLATQARPIPAFIRLICRSNVETLYTK